jgi:hypothetical protein
MRKRKETANHASRAARRLASAVTRKQLKRATDKNPGMKAWKCASRMPHAKQSAASSAGAV